MRDLKTVQQSRLDLTSRRLFLKITRRSALLSTTAALGVTAAPSAFAHSYWKCRSVGTALAAARPPEDR
jgi:hypothetical protein